MMKAETRILDRVMGAIQDSAGSPVAWDPEELPRIVAERAKRDRLIRLHGKRESALARDSILAKYVARRNSPLTRQDRESTTAPRTVAEAKRRLSEMDSKRLDGLCADLDHDGRNRATIAATPEGRRQAAIVKAKTLLSKIGLPVQFNR